LIPVFLPRLVKFDAISKYLEEIDSNRIYSNIGPLTIKFLNQISKLFNIDNRRITLVSNCTLGLTQILTYIKMNNSMDKDKKYVICPDWSFTATGLSIINAGFEPIFLDVDKNTMDLTVDIVEDFLQLNQDLSEKIAAIMIVCPFGKELNFQKWSNFHRETKIDIVVDGAANFDTFSSNQKTELLNFPGFIGISLHATKIFPIGEGGIVISPSAHSGETISSMGNFGFNNSRESEIIGTNSKMSEYCSAIGLATLDTWPMVRSIWIEKKNSFKSIMSNLTQFQSIYTKTSQDYICTTGNIFSTKEAFNIDDFQNYLYSNKISSKRWWPKPLSEMKAFRSFSTGLNINASTLSREMIGIPFYIDLQEEKMQYVCTIINKYDALQ
jgi:dTDP-4-amino-4,6-dideoxygalactose transaminase